MVIFGCRDADLNGKDNWVSEWHRTEKNNQMIQTSREEWMRRRIGEDDVQLPGGKEWWHLKHNVQCFRATNEDIWFLFLVQRCWWWSVEVNLERKVRTDTDKGHHDPQRKHFWHFLSFFLWNYLSEDINPAAVYVNPEICLCSRYKQEREHDSNFRIWNYQGPDVSG